MSIITDHALLRWIERVHGVDIEALRSQVADMCAPAVQAGASTAPVGAVWAVIQHGRVVTILPQRPKNMTLKAERMVAGYVAPPPEKPHWKHKIRKRVRW